MLLYVIFSYLRIKVYDNEEDVSVTSWVVRNWNANKRFIVRGENHFPNFSLPSCWGKMANPQTVHLSCLLGRFRSMSKLSSRCRFTPRRLGHASFLVASLLRLLLWSLGMTSTFLPSPSPFNPSETIVSYKLLHAQTYRRNFVLRDFFNQDASMFTISATVRINVLWSHRVCFLPPLCPAQYLA